MKGFCLNGKCWFAIGLIVAMAVAANETGSQETMIGSKLHGLEKTFLQWMREYGVVIEKTEELFHRFHIFKQNDRMIQAHNSQQVKSYTLAHNAFSHLTWTEFKKGHFGLAVSPEYVRKRMEKANATALFRKSSKVSVPKSVDWVTLGGVTPVKNQGQCGSCWAFSTTGAVEGAAFVSSKKLLNLSEQELVDCDHNGDMGCNGGLMEHAFKWIEEKGGLCSEDGYTPYHAARGLCRKCENVVEVHGFQDVSSGDEDALKEAVAQQPVSVAIEADQPAFQFYKSGVFNSQCGNKLDHGVLVVGYGEENGQKFWKVKNSWGPKWGENGFIKLVRDIGIEGGQCGVAMVPSYPLARVFEKKKIILGIDAPVKTAPVYTEMIKKDVDTTLVEEHLSLKVAPKSVVSTLHDSSASISQCGDKHTSLVVFSDLTISPKTPKRGSSMHFLGKGSNTKSFQVSDFKLKVSLGDEEVYSHSGSMCGKTHIPLPLGLGHINVFGFDCPATPGPFNNVGMEVHLPVIAPPGKYTFELTSSADSDSLFCIHGELGLDDDDESGMLFVIKENLSIE